MSEATVSPCTGVCTLGADGLCQGCLRSGSEIAEWPAASDARRRQILDEVAGRGCRRSGGTAARPDNSTRDASAIG